MTDPVFQVWFVVRYLHVAAVALLAGGALLLALHLFRAQENSWHAASTYEYAFWALIGLVAVTGISNLGLKGEGLLGPVTSWGRALSVKLVIVLAFLAVSLLRSDFVIRTSASLDALTARTRAVAGGLYAVTVAMMLVVMWLGLGLAHGRY